MNQDRFYQRIDPIDNIDDLSKMVCEEYDSWAISNPSYQIAIGNDSDENRMYLELGKFGLTLDVNMCK